MKKIFKEYRMSKNDVFPITERHIHLLRILAFASEGIDFTKEENTHFEDCRPCRLKVIDALRNVEFVIPAAGGTSMRRAA